MNRISHGFLGKFKTYEIPVPQVKKLTPEEREKALREKIKPWVYDPEKLVRIGGYVPTTTPPPPVETFYLETAEGDALQTAQGDNILWYIEPTPPSPFSPTDISNLTNWWESNSGITTDANGVLSWTDSISSNVATRSSTTFNNTTDVLNGYTGITQTGANTALNLSSSLDLSSTTIFVVYKTQVIPGADIYYIMGDTTSGLFTNFNNVSIRNGIYNNPDVCAGGSLIETAQYGTFIMDATDYFYRQNGNATATSPISSGGNMTFTRLYNGNVGRSLLGTIWEILVYDRALNGTEIGQVETYIQNKYGL